MQEFTDRSTVSRPQWNNQANLPGKERKMPDERQRFLIRYARGFAPFIVARASGAWLETNEIALRIAKMHTGRFEVVGLTRSWHGLQAGTGSLHLAGGHSGYGPLMPGSLTLPAPSAHPCPIRHCNGTCDWSRLAAGFDLRAPQAG